MSEKPTVGFVGVGNMGWPMAACLVRAGFTVHVNDSRREVADNFVQQIGGSAPDSLKQLAAGADVVITMLPTSKIVSHVLADAEDSILAGIRPGTIVIEMSSGEPTVTQRLAGRGKALNNLVSAGGFLIGIEALLIGQRFGLDAEVMVDVLNAATGMNNSTQKKFKQFVLSRKFDSGFSLDLLVKDLSIALGVGRETGTPTPFSALCRELAASTALLLGPGADHTEFARLSEKLAGEELGAKK